MFFAAGLDCGLGRLVKLCGARRRRKTAMRFPLGSPRAVRPGRPVVRRLAYEQLEDRRLLAVTVVDTLLDAVDPNDGVTSLREAIAETNARPGADEIRFNLSASDARVGIRLSQGEIAITDALDIQGTLGLGKGILGISGVGTRVFHIDDGRSDATSRVRMSDLRLYGVAAQGDGGAIMSVEPLELMRVTINGTSSGNGGAIYATAGLIATELTISQASVSFDGGAIWAAGGVEISDSTITGNSARQNGGSLAIVGNLTIRNSSIGGTASLAGGGIYVTSVSAREPANVLIADSKIQNSISRRGGGAAWDQWTEFVSLNSLWSNNSVSFDSRIGNSGVGGGLFGEGPLVLAHSTVIRNTVDGSSSMLNGAGVRAKIVYLTNSVVATNSGSQEPDVSLIPGGVIASDYSLVGNSLGSGLANEQPNTRHTLLGRPPDRLNPTQQVLNPKLGFTDIPLAGSPVIDAGDPAVKPGDNGLSEFDLRRAPNGRIVGGRIDIGAYEFQTNADSLQANFNSDQIVDGADLLAWQRKLGTTSAATIFDGDATNDGDVDGSDLAVWRFHFGKAAAQAAIVAPTTAPILALVTTSDSAAITAVDVAQLAQAHASFAAAADAALAHFRPGRRGRWFAG